MSAALVVLTGMNPLARAAAVPLINPDFETDLAADGSHNSSVTGWVGVGNGVHDTFDPGATHGVGFGLVGEGENNYLFISANGSQKKGVSQTAVTTIQANSTYTLKFDVGNLLFFSFPSWDPDDAYSSGSTLFLARLRTSGGLGFAQSLNATLVSSSSSIPPDGSTTTWTRVYQTGAAPADLGGALDIEFYLENAPFELTNAVLIDNVSLERTTPTIPEPGSLTLLALGGLAWTAARRRAFR